MKKKKSLYDELFQDTQSVDVRLTELRQGINDTDNKYKNALLKEETYQHILTRMKVIFYFF